MELYDSQFSIVPWLRPQIAPISSFAEKYESLIIKFLTIDFSEQVPKNPKLYKSLFGLTTRPEME